MTGSPTPVTPVTCVTSVTLATEQARTRLHELTVSDVRTPAECASGHLPGALNIPLDHVRRVLPEMRHASEKGDILVVCASGARSENACKLNAGSLRSRPRRPSGVRRPCRRPGSCR